MHIEVFTDKNILGSRELVGRIRTTLEHSLGRFAEQVTRIEAHLSDENSNKKSGPADKRCVLEARLAGHTPVSVRHQAPAVDLAVDGAAGKLERALDRTLARLNRR
ncbi:HPF/RaiA family ribosome-associated protein [bacterium]|nr:HPF/RaiA family ribosome-associated protein [bacterium]